MLLTSCGSDDEGIEFGSVGFVEGFFGAVAADEPNAVLVGRDILSSGGTAADAAVAVGFALAVTLPSRASLGSGGVCLVHDPTTGSTEALDFIPAPGSPGNPRVDRPSAIPALTRGMVAMHARYGEMDWRTLLRPAEDLARFGHRLPRAFSKDLELAAKLLFVDPEARRIFGRGGVNPIDENQRYRQLDLAALLGQLRINGAGVMYNGPVAKKIVDGVAQAGGTLTIEDLRDWLPEWRATLIQPFDRNFVEYETHVAPLPAAGGIMAAQMIAMLRQDGRFVDADETGRNHLLAAVGQRAYAGRAGWLNSENYTATDPLVDLLDEDFLEELMRGFDPNRATPSAALQPQPVQIRENPAGASFVVVDGRGGAVACSLTMYNLFGTGRVVPNTGIVLAAAPDAGPRNPLPLGPVMVVRPGNFRFSFAIAGSGGVATPTSIANVAARSMLIDGPARDAVDAPRVHHGGTPDVVFVEEAIGPEAASALQALGYTVQPESRFGRVNVIYCGSDLPPSEAETPVSCSASGDRRGFGMAVQAD